jgi:hypothetical protein
VRPALLVHLPAAGPREGKARGRRSEARRGRSSAASRRQIARRDTAVRSCQNGRHACRCAEGARIIRDACCSTDAGDAVRRGWLMTRTLLNGTRSVWPLFAGDDEDEDDFDEDDEFEDGDEEDEGDEDEDDETETWQVKEFGGPGYL